MSEANGDPSSTEKLERFEEWWQAHGQFCRAGGGDYEKTFAYRAWEAATSGLFDVETQQFLTDSMTAAGMLYYGKQTKGFRSASRKGQQNCAADCLRSNVGNKAQP